MAYVVELVNRRRYGRFPRRNKLTGPVLGCGMYESRGLSLRGCTRAVGGNVLVLLIRVKSSRRHSIFEFIVKTFEWTTDIFH